MHFVMTRQQRQTSTLNAKNYKIEVILEAYLKENKIIIEMNQNFQENLKKKYAIDFTWNKIFQKLQIWEINDNITNEINFIIHDNLLYYSSSDASRKLMISFIVKKKVFQIIHDQAHHCEFHRVYVRLHDLNIKHVSKRLRRYIKFCKQCNEDQIKRHFSHEELNSIQTSAILFHTIIIDFVIALLLNVDKLDVFFFTTNKFFKRIELIVNKITWNVSQWAQAWLDMLQKKAWNLSRIIIFDRDKKFLNELWKATFHHLKVKLFYITAYHLNVNDQSKRKNQTVELVTRLAMIKGEITNFTILLSSIQKCWTIQQIHLSKYLSMKLFTNSKSRNSSICFLSKTRELASTTKIYQSRSRKNKAY